MVRLIKFSLVLWFFVFFCAALVSCTTYTAEVGHYISNGVEKYCAKPESERIVIRTEVNSLIAPNSFKITCSGDVPQ